MIYPQVRALDWQTNLTTTSRFDRTTYVTDIFDERFPRSEPCLDIHVTLITGTTNILNINT